MKTYSKLFVLSMFSLIIIGFSFGNQKGSWTRFEIYIFCQLMMSSTHHLNIYKSLCYNNCFRC